MANEDEELHKLRDDNAKLQNQMVELEVAKLELEGTVKSLQEDLKELEELKKEMAKDFERCPTPARTKMPITTTKMRIGTQGKETFDGADCSS